MARFHCSQCKISKDVPDVYLGRKVRCPGCGREISVLPTSDASRGAVSAQPMPEDSATINAPADEERLVFRCVSCGHEQHLPQRFAGRKARCPACGDLGRVGGNAKPPSEGDVDLDDLAQDMAEPGGRTFSGLLDEHAGDSFGASLAGAQALSPEDGASSLGDGRLKTRSVSLVRSVLNGLALGMTAVLFSLALAMAPTVGSGDAELYPIMLQMALTAALLGSLVYTLRSRVPFATAGSDGVTGAGLFLIAQAVVALGGVQGLPTGVLAPTLIFALVGSALLSGLFCIFFSQLQDGGWMRFVPFPVVGGVLAGLGVLLIQIAYQARTGEALGLDLLLGALRGSDSLLFAHGAYWRWLPSMLFGLVLFLAFQRIRAIWWLAMPMLLAIGWSIVAPRLEWTGIMPGLLPGESVPMTLTGLLQIHSPAFWMQANGLGLLELPCLLFAIALLLTVNAASKTLVFEEHLGREVSPGPELRAVGAANIISGLAFGFPVTLAQGRSLGNLHAGGLGAVGAVVAAAVCGAALFAGGPLLAAIPPVVPAGLLWFMGLNLLKRWLVDVIADDLRSEEYACLILTFAVTVGIGFAPGVVAGVFLALVLGLARLSSSSAIKQIMSGDAHHSNVDRAPVQTEALHRLGESIFILRLRGFLSSGSLSTGLRAIWERMEEPGRRPVRSVILDFTNIKGFGSGLTRVFSGMARLGQEHDVLMVLTNVPFVLEERLEKVGLAGQEREGFVLFQNLDFALEWCEDRLLDESGLLEMEALSLDRVFEPVFPDKEAMPHLMRILQRVEVRSGEYVFRQGDASDAMFFVESGMLTVELEIPGGKTVRLKKLGAGSIFGEMGIYTHAERSASVRASERSVVHRLSKKRLAILREKLPQLATSLDRFLVTLLARRVADANSMVRDLMR